MVLKQLFFISLTLLFVTGCGPVKIEGDVFLVKGDGTPQPAAAKDVIFIKGNSLEEILIDSYIETINNEKINYKTSTLCSSLSNLLKNEIAESEESLNTAKLDQVSNNITDQDGTCSNKQSQLEQASIAYQDRKSEYELVLTDLKLKRSELREIIENKQKIINDIYDKYTFNGNADLSDYLILFLRRIARTIEGDFINLEIRNISNIPVSLSGKICVQFLDEGRALGKTFDKLADCNVDQDNLYDGVQIVDTDINLPDYLRPGETRLSDFSFNYFCKSQSMRIINDFRVLIPSKKNDKSACGFSPDNEFILRHAINNKILFDKNIILFESEVSLLEEDVFESWEDIAGIDANILKIENQIKEDSLRLSMVDAQEGYDICTSTLENNDQATENISFKNSQLEIVSSCQYDESYKILNTYRSDLPVPTFVDDFFIGAVNEEALKIFSNPDYVTQTGINGHYQIDEIQKGNYVAISTYTDSFNSGIYIQELTIDGDLNIDFNNNTFISSVSITGIIESFYRECKDQFCNEIDLKGSLDLEVLERLGIQQEKELKKLNEQLERILRQ